MPACQVCRKPVEGDSPYHPRCYRLKKLAVNENLNRREYRLSELPPIVDFLLLEEREKAQERSKAGKKAEAAGRALNNVLRRVGKKGCTSPTAYRQLLEVLESGQKDMIQLVDKGKVKIAKAFKEVRTRRLKEQIRNGPVAVPTDLTPNRVVVCADKRPEQGSLAVLKTIPDASFDAIVTDPPFGIGLKYGDWTETSNAKDYREWFSPFLEEMLRILKPGGLLALWQAKRYLRHFWDWYGNDIVIFAACQVGKTTSHDWRRHLWQPIVLTYKPGGTALTGTGLKINHVRVSLGNKADFVYAERVHECPRTISECRRIIKSYVIPEGKILDPFAGLGTIGVATLQEGEGRTYYGIELREDMVKLANAALEREEQGLNGKARQELVSA